MANSILWSQALKTECLRSSDMYIGTGDVSKHPSSFTGFYAARDNFSSGVKYNIYLAKTINKGPSIYEATSDSELISFMNQITGFTFTSAKDCWIYARDTPTDLVITNRNYERTKTGSLVLLIDPGFLPSYIGDAGIYDISQYQNHLGFNGSGSLSQSRLTFTGAETVDAGSAPQYDFGSAFAIDLWVRISSSANGVIIAKNNPGNSGIGPFGISQAGGQFKFEINGIDTISNTSINYNTWTNIIFNFDGSIGRIYINGSYDSDLAGATLTTSTGDLTLGSLSNGASGLTMDLSRVCLYSEPLSIEEMKMNSSNFSPRL